MITTQYMTSFTPEEMALLIEQGKAKDARIAELEAALAAATEREWALQVGFTACIDTLWRYARLAARERGESETGQLMSANEAVGHFRAALAAAQQEDAE